jgi:hypothetical protein
VLNTTTTRAYARHREYRRLKQGDVLFAELRQRATREGYCYQHVQAITVAIDQYAEKALGNRDYFLNKPYGAG